MRPGAALALFLLLLAPGVLPATDKSPHELYAALNSLRLDPDAVYQIVPSNRIELRRGDLQLTFEEGKIAFFAPLDARLTGAVFFGRGHVLAMPRDPVEKQQMARFLGAPVLDEEFLNAYVRFTDETAEELLRQFRKAGLPPQRDAAFCGDQDALLAQLNPPHSLRILFESLAKNPRPYFFATLDGVSTGTFDVLFDMQRQEQFLLGQPRKIGKRVFYDVWASYKFPGATAPSAAFHALRYTLDVSVLPDNSLDGVATVHLHAEASGERLLTFQLSHALNADRVTDEHGHPLDYFQNPGTSPQRRNVLGNDFLYVVLPDAPQQGDELALRVHYRGRVIEDAGNGVLYVGARECWYPRLGDDAEFAHYDLTLRWPRRVKLVATGTKIEEHDDGEFRLGRWRTEKPIPVAGFNLGEYSSATISSESRSIDLYANRQLEQALSSRLAPVIEPDRLPTPATEPLAPLIRERALMQPPAPSPADALKQLGKEIDSSIHFYEKYSGPFPFHTLSVSQIPGTFGQGWPGLLYLSTFSFLPAQAQLRAGLTPTGQQELTDVVPFHEVAHQWWGNIVSWSSYRDQWIDEALANYLALLFADSRQPSEHVLRRWLERYRNQLLEKPLGADEPASEFGAITLGTRLNSSKSPDGYDQVIYRKGAWIMHMLRELLRQPSSKNPDAGFISLLQVLDTKYAYRALSTSDLQREVEAVMTPAMSLEGGRSMDWFFDQWVRGTGIPRYRLQFTVHREDKGYVVKGKLYQTGVPRSFIAPVPLFASPQTGHNFPLGIVIAEGPETSFHFLAPSPPRKLLIDPQMTLLCTTQ